MFQDKIKREKPPHHDRRSRFPPVTDILDSERPIERLPGNPARSPAAVKCHMIAFYRFAPLKQCPHDPAGRAPVSLEVMTELSAGENAAVETDQGDPFRFPSGPSKGRKRPLPSLQMLDHRLPVTTARSPCR